MSSPQVALEETPGYASNGNDGGATHTANRVPDTGLTAEVPGRSLQLLLLTVVVTVTVSAKVVLGPLQETMRSALGLSDNQIALLQGPALVLPMIMAAIPLGLMIDRWCRVRLLAALLGVILAGSVLTAVAGNFTVLFLGRALVGLASFSMLPAVLSVLADYFPPAERGRANMATLIGQFAGFSVAFALGGELVVTPQWGSDAWRWSVLWLTGPSLALVLLLTAALREPPRNGQLTHRPSLLTSFAEVRNYRVLLLWPTLSGILILVALSSVMIWATPALARSFSLSPDRVGGIMAVVMPLGGIGGTVLGGLLADYCQRNGGPHRTISCIVLLCATTVPLGLFAIAPSWLVASGVLVALVAILTATCVMASTLFMIVIPNEIRGFTYGLFGGVGALLGGFSPLLVSSISSMLGGDLMIGRSLSIVCVLTTLLATMAYAGARRHFVGARVF